MSCIPVTGEFCIVVRRAALEEKGVEYRELLQTFGVSAPLGGDDALISFGPSFGGEALDNLTKALISLGLSYWDDFFDLAFNSPDWCQFQVCSKGR